MASDEIRSRSDLDFVITLGGNKIQEAALHRGNFSESSTTPLQTVRDLDGIASIQLPSTWFRIEQNTALADATTFRPSTIDKTQISFYTGTKPLNEQSIEAFEQVINADLPIPRIIYSEALQEDYKANIQTIQDLSRVFGSTTVGDNQLTSSTSRRPAFHLETAKVETVNGKNVVAVDGWFTQLDDYAQIKMDENGPMKCRYSAIFFETNSSKDSASKIRKLYLQADESISFASHKAVFRTALKSIEWN
jgi:hypothetical protein